MNEIDTGLGWQSGYDDKVKGLPMREFDPDDSAAFRESYDAAYRFVKR